MDNNTTPATDDLTVSDAVRIVAVEAGKAALIATVQVTAVYLTLGCVALAAQKIQDRRAAKAAAKLIETTPEND